MNKVLFIAVCKCKIAFIHIIYKIFYKICSFVFALAHAYLRNLTE